MAFALSALFRRSLRSRPLLVPREPRSRDVRAGFRWSSQPVPTRSALIAIEVRRPVHMRAGSAH